LITPRGKEVAYMHLVHLTASTFFGGPERQMLGLACHMAPAHQSSFLSFAEGGRCTAFLNEVARRGFTAEALQHDTPHIQQAIAELKHTLQRWRADAVLCHTFKPNVLGHMAARQLGIPCVVVSRGWTWENWKVRAYETVDRLNLRYVDHVVAVSHGQAERVRRAGVPRSRLSVIRNAARLNAFQEPNPAGQAKLRSHFKADMPLSAIIVAAGRLSPEKGIAVLVDAAANVLKQLPTVGFVVFGEGTERTALEAQIQHLGIADRFKLAGFTNELDQVLPWADVLALPSFTEGLPNVALEASAAGVPVVATAVGGTPEVIAHDVNGLLVPSGNPAALSEQLIVVLTQPVLRQRLGEAGVQRMHESFTFQAQADAYTCLLEKLCRKTARQKQRVA
jgi:glycosyltransferase involved in cell wall biosynthesis